jgi:cellulose synthase operon protein C
MLSGSAICSIVAVLAGCGGGGSSEDFVASGRKLLDAGDTAGAIIQFKNALQKQPDNGEVRYLLGSALLRSGSAQQAIVEYRKAIAQGYDSREAASGVAGGSPHDW